MRSHNQFGLALLAVYAGLYMWLTPGLYEGRLTTAELDSYLADIDRGLSFMPAEDRKADLERLRAWGADDDGKPVYMLNLMRTYASLHKSAALENFSGTPSDANAYYEGKAFALLFKNGDYPIYGGTPQGSNLFGHEPDADNWGRVLLVRYGDRRHFLQLIANPAYAPIAPYKFAAEQLDLVPTGAELVVSDLRILIAALFLGLYVIAGWISAARRSN